MSEQYKSVSIENIAEGKLIQFIDVNLTNLISEILSEASLTLADMGRVEPKDIKGKINIEVSIEMKDDRNYIVHAKVKKTTPQASCVSFAVQDGDKLMFKSSGGNEYSPDQRTIEEEIEEQEAF